MSSPTKYFYRFGDFTIDADQRVLLHEGKPIALTPKVFDTLLVLVENSGRIVTKEELMNRLWPDTFVEEANLAYNIQQLRKTFGDNARNPLYIKTIARRGYRFIASVDEVFDDTHTAGGQITRQYETSDARSPDAGNGLNRQVEAQMPEPDAELANESHSAASEKSFDAKATPGAAQTRVSRRSVAIAAALVIALAGAGLVFWMLFDKGIDSKSQQSSPLKFEKLTGTGQSSHVAISPDGKYLAYTRHFERRSSIWLRQFATNTNVEIVPATDSTPIYGLAFANSGESLYFVKGNPTSLYRVSLLGGVPTKVADKLEGNFSVSADDSQIAFIRQVINRDGQREYSLIIANSDGSGERMLLSGTHPGKLDVPVWSPDGKSIICASGNSDGGSQDVSIVEVRVSDWTAKELAADRFFRITKMAWLPDKSGLIMSARRNLGGNNQLWRVSYPGIEISQITEGLTSYLDLSIASSMDKTAASQATLISDIYVGTSRELRTLKRITQAIDKLCWAPDGRLVYTSTASGNRDIWIMEPDGSEQRQLTVNTAVNGSPAVTPDNRYIVFLSNRTGVQQVWRMDMDGSNQIQLTDGAGKDHPAISPDGKWVLYNTTDDWRLWKVSIDGGDPDRLTDYFAYRPSVSPDGEMIACTGRQESKREVLILPFEGGEPLKRLFFTEWSSRLQWTEGGKALIYGIERNGVTSLIKQSLDGGPPEEIIDFAEDELFDFGYSFDGQSLAVTRGSWQHDIVLISGLNQY